MTSPSATEAKDQRTTGITVALGLFALVFGFAALLSLPTYLSRSNPVWFIGMLIIFASSLALIAVAFRWLGLAAPAEAFGLPAGSIRTLLAAGVMVLFSVFGLQALAPDPAQQHRVADLPLQSDLVPFAGTAADLKTEIARYQSINVAAVVQSSDKDGAKLKLYRIEREKYPEITDLQKQIITALITLLTSVVSFYFGSRTAEASRDSSDAAKKLPESTAEDVKRIDAQLDDARKRLTALHGEHATAGNEAAFASSLSQADAQLKTVEDAHTKLAAAIKDLGTGNSTPEAIATAATGLAATLAALGKLLSQAEAMAAKG